MRKLDLHRPIEVKSRPSSEGVRKSSELSSSTSGFSRSLGSFDFGRTRSANSDRNSTERAQRTSSEGIPVGPSSSSPGTGSSNHFGWNSPSFSKSLCLETPLGAVLFKGYLNKQGKNRLVKKWQQRFFALYDGRLVYWADERDFVDKRKPKGVIDLHECSIATAEQHTKRINTIGIFHTHRRDYYVEAASKANLLEWVTRIEAMLGVGEEGVGLDDFDVLNLIGKGAYGQVFQVKKKDSGKVYAMKMISKEGLKKKGGECGDFERDLSESQTLQGLINVEKALYKHWLVESTKAERRVLEVVNHPFIVKLHFAFQTSEKLCLVLDFINGGELFSYIAREKTFTEARARFYCAEIILALEYLHEMGIIYRDLKPENILLDAHGHVVLTDFGHSKDEHSRNDRRFSMVGSAYYMAPEILMAKGHGSEVDWWSLGILVYEMLVGLPPFYSENPQLAYEKLLTKPIEFPDHVSKLARYVVVRLLHVDPKLRLGAQDPGGGAEPGNDTPRIARKWNVAWFKGVQWAALLARQVDPPFKPKVRGIMDISHFSSHFTSEMVNVGGGEDYAPPPRGFDIFQDFEYVAPVSEILLPLPSPSPKTSPSAPSSGSLHPPLFDLNSPSPSLPPSSSPSIDNPNTPLSPPHPHSAPLSASSLSSKLFKGGGGEGGGGRKREEEEWTTGAQEAGAKEEEEGEREAGGKPTGEDDAYGETPAGRRILKAVPGAMTARLKGIEDRNRERQKREALRGIGNPQLGSMVVSATDFMQECKWDMHLAAASLTHALARREEIEECFASTSKAPPGKGGSKGQELISALERCLEQHFRAGNASHYSLAQRATQAIGGRTSTRRHAGCERRQLGGSENAML